MKTLKANKMYLRVISAIFVAFILMGITTLQPLANETDENSIYPSYVFEMLDLLNKERARVGVQPLVIDEDLATAANIRSNELTVKYDHERPNGQRGYEVNDKAMSENIAYGYKSVGRVVQAWFESPSHYQAIINPDFKTVGLSKSISQDNTTYWTQLFGTQLDQKAQVDNFVIRLYDVFLDRKPDPNGFRDFTGKLINQSQTAGTVLSRFILSNEFENNNYSDTETIEKFYEGFFGRASDEGGKGFWLDSMVQGSESSQVAAGFMESQEYLQMCNSYNVIPGTFSNPS